MGEPEWGIQASSEVAQFLRSLPPKHAAKVRHLVGRLALFGPNLPFPSSSHLDGPFRELRTSFAGQQYRVIYARKADTFYLLAAFQKTSDRDLPAAIRRARAAWTHLEGEA